MSVFQAATLTLAPGPDGFSGVLSIGDEIAFEVRRWHRVAGGQVRCEMRVEDLAYRQYLARLGEKVRA